MACRVVCNLRKYYHVSASMYSLHWLIVREHITYKIAYLIHCCKMSLTPQYLIDVLPAVNHNCSLRSLISSNLPSAKCWTSLVSEGSFSAVGPKIWNSLPPGVWFEKSSNGFRKGSKNISLQTIIPNRYASFSLVFYILCFLFYHLNTSMDMYSILEMVSLG